MAKLNLQVSQIDKPLVAKDGLIIAVDALLDTGFTDVAVNAQDAESLGWQIVDSEETRLTAI